MEHGNNPGRARRVAGVTRGFYIHLAAYVVVNAVLVGINLATTPERLWFRWPLLGWGIGILAHTIVTFAVTRKRASRGG
jgi:hypothetical protein